MSYKLKYSSLLCLKKKNRMLLLNGPLGCNYLKIPEDVTVSIDNFNQIIIFSFKKLKNKEKHHLNGLIATFKSSCQALVFGDLMDLNIQGLGLKFVKLVNVSNKNVYLSMNLGYSDLVNYPMDSNCSICFFRDNRNISIYSSCYHHLCNKVACLAMLKKPNKFQKRDNGIRVSSSFI
jgi:ribosomal protein L6P/L9E